MNDIKKVLIVAICVVLVIAIAAGVSIGVMANTMNGLKDKVAELDQAYASDMAAVKAEIEAAKAANENLVTAADFEAKLAAAIGEQNQTMQSLISTAVKNQIEDLEVEGLTEEQVNAIIDAAVANCLTEADIDAIIADVDTGLTKAEVKKIVADYTAGSLTYAQIVNLIDDADYDLRAYLEKQIKAVADAVEDLGGDVSKLEQGAKSQVTTLDEFKAALADATISKITLMGDIETAESIEIRRNVTLNLNGHEISYTEEGKVPVPGENPNLDALLDIQNADVVITGDGALTTNFQHAINVQNHAKVTIENGTFTSKGVTVFAWSYCDCYGDTSASDIEKATVIINGGTFTCDDELSDQGVTHAAVFAQGDTSEVTINGGEFKGDNGNFAIMVHAGNVVVNNGSFDSTFATTNVNTGGTLTIKGGEFSCNADYREHADILYVQGSNGSIVVSGGTFVGQNPATQGEGASIVYGYEVVKGTAYEYTVQKAETASTTVTGDVTLAEDVTTTTIQQENGILDGNGNTITVENKNDDTTNYGVNTTGGTVQNVTIKGEAYTYNDKTYGFRAIMVSNLTDNLVLNNVTALGTYGINISNGNSKTLTVTNSTIGDWNSYSGLASATFTGCTFVSNGNYLASQRVSANATFTYENCEFNQNTYEGSEIEKYYLSSYNGTGKIVLKNCTVDGVKITSENVEEYFHIDNTTNYKVEVTVENN